MKVWQLYSIASGNTALLEQVAASSDQWKHLYDIYRDIDRIIDAQDRAKLDADLPEDFARTALEKIDLLLFLSGDGVLRSRSFSPHDIPIKVADAFKAYGGDAIEEALEHGSYKLT